jgi:hypothetical protein
MKTILSTFALMTVIGLAAEVAPPADPAPEQADETSRTEIVERSVQRAVEQAKRASEKAVEQAKRATQQAARQAQRAMQLVQSRLSSGEAEAGESEPLEDIPVGNQNFDEGWNFAFNSSGRNPNQPLVLRTSDADATTVSNLQEDLSVMSRIVTKAVEREVGRDGGHEAALGIVLSTLPGGRHPQSLYLEGYGALFLVNVKFPLVAPPTKEDEKAEKSPDTTWEQTRRELNNQKAGTLRVWNINPAGDAPVEYQAEQVETLKKELIETLKNASNIRGLKPEESVTIALVGSRSGAGVTRVKQTTNRNTGRNIRKNERVTLTDSARGAGRESVLTIRAKKADIDAYAKGTLDLSEFTKRTSTTAY